MITARTLAAQAFAEGDRVRTSDGRTGTVDSVNEYAAAVVTVQLDQQWNPTCSITPFLFTELTRVRPIEAGKVTVEVSADE